MYIQIRLAVNVDKRLWIIAFTLVHVRLVIIYFQQSRRNFTIDFIIQYMLCNRIPII